MAKPYASQPLYHSIVLPVSFEHPTAVLIQDMSTNPHTLGLWNIAHLKLEHHLNRVQTFAFSPNGELISDWGGGIVRLWDLRVGNIHPLPRKSNLVLLVTIDGATLWEFPTGTPQNQFEALKNPITGPEFSGDGRLVAAFAKETIIVWDTGNGKLIRTLELDVDDSDIECYASIKAAFRPDGKIITWALDTLQFQSPTMVTW
ncbi:hypothetical protein AtubIFM56815_002704 [Aspergillus tubingensis]|uniref:Uncharacterized protein n=1 Tax=Aspergillus tubingensis TaxID=5068 RepID=A0A9W6ER31_ASPTU|nr:hypothetical protein AtubIFM56815_002704 [Aspergillus tubingensis]